MSTIPSNAMPKAGGTGYGAGATAGTVQSGSPDRHYTNETSIAERGGWRAKARDNKGVAIGLAFGAVAAAAIPFMLSARRKSSAEPPARGGQQYDYDITTGERKGSTAKA